MAVILVADDEPDITSLLSTVLTGAGHTVHTVSDGRTALARITELRPDLSVLDHYMPEMTGLRVAETLRADPATSSLPLLMLSAAAPCTAVLHCNVVLAKPVSLQHFGAVVRDLLRPPPPSDPLRDLGRIHAVSALLDAYTEAVGARLDDLAGDLASATGAGMASVDLVMVDAVAVCGSYGLDGWIREAGGLPAEWTPCIEVVRTGEPVLIGDLRGHPPFDAMPLATVTGVRSYAGVPLVDAESRLVGTLDVMDRGPHAFTAATLDRLAASSRTALDILRW